MDGPIIPPLAFPPPPPPPPANLCIVGGDSNLLSKSMMFGGRRGSKTRRKKARKATIDSVPNELLIDILARFPADFLHDGATLVCRRWYNLIHSKVFINTQLPRSTYGLVLSSSLESRSYPHSIYVTATQEGRIRTNELRSIRQNKILASGDGLAVELRRVNVDESLSLHVINPTTKQCFLLPSVSTRDRVVYHERCGIAYSAASMEYKVTLPYYDDRLESVCLDILTVGVDKSWRRVEIPPLLEDFRSLFYLSPLTSEGGFLHWAEGVDCLTLNVETEIFTTSEVPIPCYVDYSYCYLSTGRYLSLLVGRGNLSWKVWEMRPAESGDQWVKVVPSIQLEAQKCSELSSGRVLCNVHPLGWVKYLEVLGFHVTDTWIFYNLERHETTTIGIELPDIYRCSEYRAIVHRNSLMCWEKSLSFITPTNIESLSDELLFDILVRLPAHFLHDIAGLVCRRWSHIIRSDAFVNTHLQRSSYGLLLSFPWHPHAIYVTATQGRRIETSVLRDICRNKLIAASCNGLSLEVIRSVHADFEDLSLRVINPATKQSFILPSISKPKGIYVYSHTISIGYSAASMEYKVTLPYLDFRCPLSTCIHMLTVGVDKSWRRVEVPPLPKDFGDFFWFRLSSEGFLHYGRERYCLTLNVETETITMTEAPIPPPYHHRHYWYHYLSTGRYLTLLANRDRESSWEVWEMRPAESGEWRKGILSNIDLEPQKSKLRQEFGYDGKQNLVPVGWVKYPEALAFSFSPRETCIIYNLETHEINAIDLPNHEYLPLVHRNSLVRLNQTGG